MNTLGELIERDNVTAVWFWTHDASTGPGEEYEVWDLVLVRDTNEPPLYVTDGATRRTVYFKGIGGCQADSRRATGGEHREPDRLDTLANLLDSAIDADNNPTFKEWCANDERSGSAHEQVVTYQRLVQARDLLREWLGDEYDEYISADLSG